MRVCLLFLFAALSWAPSASAQTGKSMSAAELAAYSRPDREKVLYEGAKKEGKVTWYTSLTGGPNTDVPRVFLAKYPGVAVEVYRGDSGAGRSRACQMSGRFSARLAWRSTMRRRPRRPRRRRSSILRRPSRAERRTCAATFPRGGR